MAEFNSVKSANFFSVLFSFILKLLKSTSVKKACKKFIRDQKFGTSPILKIEYQSPFKNVAYYISELHNMFIG